MTVNPSQEFEFGQAAEDIECLVDHAYRILKDKLGSEMVRGEDVVGLASLIQEQYFLNQKD